MYFFGFIANGPFYIHMLHVEKSIMTRESSSAPLFLNTGQTATGKFGEDNPRNFTDLQVKNKTQNIPTRENPMPCTK